MLAEKYKLHETTDGVSTTLDPSAWAIIKNSEALRAIGSRILVLEDEFKSGYECSTCAGKGHTDVVCPHCKGTTFHKAKEENGACPDCEVGTSDGRKSFGYTLCPTCKGKQSLIVIPDSSKRRPVTGRVLSIGSDVKEFKVGTRVMYTNFTGTDFEIRVGTETIKLRIMLEHDVMCEYKQLKTGATPASGNSKQPLIDVGV